MASHRTPTPAPQDGDPGENEVEFNQLLPTDPLYAWGTEPNSGFMFPISGDSGNGVFAFFNGQTVLLGGLHTGDTCSDVSDNIGGINQIMAQLWAQGQAEGIVPTGQPAEQLTTVDLSSFGQAPTLKLQGPPIANPAQSLSYTVTVDTSTGVSVPDGESVVLEDADYSNAVVGNGTFAGNTATITLAAGTLADGSHELFAAYGGDANFLSSVSSGISVHAGPGVTAAQLNGNIPALAGPQQSAVDSVVFTFDEPVNCGPNAFRIDLDAQAKVNGAAVATGVGTVPTLSWAPLNPNGDGASTQWAVSFSGDGVVDGSIANGIYIINVNQYDYSITSDAHPDVYAVGSQYLFLRLAGDYLGTGSVGFDDLLLLAQDYNITSDNPNYRLYMDTDGSGTIDFGDLLVLAQDYNISYSVT